jgi:hypothetical protein
MLVAFLALTNGTSPGTCLVKAGAAFVVFAGFGLVVRHVLVEALEQTARNQEAEADHGTGGVDVIVPGTSVADLLAGSGGMHNSNGDSAPTPN